VPVRLTDFEIGQITSCLCTFCEAGEVYLYGSRTQKDLKGGDIDLLFVVPKQLLNELQTKELKMLRCIKDNIGERKIDLTVTSKDEIEKNSFLAMIWPQAVKLNSTLEDMQQENLPKSS
jgi:hypothetical protein